MPGFQKVKIIMIFDLGQVNEKETQHAKLEA